MDARGLNPADTQRARVAGGTDLAQLNKWFEGWTRTKDMSTG